MSSAGKDFEKKIKQNLPFFLRFLTSLLAVAAPGHKDRAERGAAPEHRPPGLSSSSSPPAIAPDPIVLPPGKHFSVSERSLPHSPALIDAALLFL